MYMCETCLFAVFLIRFSHNDTWKALCILLIYENNQFSRYDIYHKKKKKKYYRSQPDQLVNQPSFIIDVYWVQNLLLTNMCLSCRHLSFGHETSEMKRYCDFFFRSRIEGTATQCIRFPLYATHMWNTHGARYIAYQKKYMREYGNRATHHRKIKKQNKMEKRWTEKR